MLNSMLKNVWGVTGPIGSGKSSLCRLLEKLGALNIDVDKIGHRLLDDPKIKSRLISAFGDTILSQEGIVDRKRLGNISFRSAESRTILNGIMHPPMREIVEETVVAYRDKSEGLVLINAALLYVMQLDTFCERVLFVTARPETRLDRLVKTRGWSNQKALSRLSCQDAIPATDYRLMVVENSGSEADLEKVARKLAGEILELSV